MKNFDLFCLIKHSINDSDNKDSKKTSKKTRNPKKIKFLNQEIQYQIYKNEIFIKNNLNNIFEKVVKNSLISEYYIIFSLINELTLIIGRFFIRNQKMNRPIIFSAGMKRSSIANQFKIIWYRKLNKKKIKYLFFYLLNKNKILKFNLSSKQLSYTKIALQNTAASQFNPFLFLFFKNFLFPVKKHFSSLAVKKKYLKQNIKTKFNLIEDGAISFCPDRKKLDLFIPAISSQSLFAARDLLRDLAGIKFLNFVYNKKPEIKKTKLINFLTKDLKLNYLTEEDYISENSKKPSFAVFYKNHSKLLKKNTLFSINFRKINSSARSLGEIAKNQITLKSDLLLKNLFYKQWFLNFLGPVKKSIFSFKNFIFTARSKSISLSIKKLFLFLYLEPKFILDLEIVLKKTNLKFLLYSCLEDKNQFSNSKANLSLSVQNKSNTTPIKKTFKITSFPSRDKTSLNNKINYFKVLKFNLCVANQITSLLLKIRILKKYSLVLSFSFYTHNKKQKKNDRGLINKNRFNLIQYNNDETSSNNRLKKTLITKKNFYKKTLEIFYKFGCCSGFLSPQQEMKKITCVGTNEFLLNSLINLSEKIFFNFLLSKVIFNIKNIINKRLQLSYLTLNVNLNKFNFKKTVLFKKYRFFNLKFNKITYRILKKKYYIFLYKSIKIYFMSNNFLFYLKKQYLSWLLHFLPRSPHPRFYPRRSLHPEIFQRSGWDKEICQRWRSQSLLCPFLIAKSVKKIIPTVNSYHIRRKNAAVDFFLEKKLIFIFFRSKASLLPRSLSRSLAAKRLWETEEDVTAALFFFLFSGEINRKNSVDLVCSYIFSILKIKKTNLFFNLNFLKNRINILNNNAKSDLFKYFFLAAKSRIILYNFIEHSTICKISTLNVLYLPDLLGRDLGRKSSKKIVTARSLPRSLLWEEIWEKDRIKSLKIDSGIYKFKIKNNLSNNIESSKLLCECSNKQKHFKQKKILIKIFNYKKTNFFFLKIKNSIIFYKQSFVCLFKNRDRDKNHATLQLKKHINKLKISHNNKGLFYKQKYNIQLLINRVDLENFFLNFYKLILKIQIKLSQIFFCQVSIFYEYKVLIFDIKGNILNKYKNTFINILYKKNLTIKKKILLHTIFSLNRKKKEFIIYGFYIFQKMVYKQPERRVNILKKKLFIKESQLIHKRYELRTLKKKTQSNLKIKCNVVAACVTNSPKSRRANFYKIRTHVPIINGDNILKDVKNTIHLDFLTFIIPSKKKLNKHNNQLKSIIFKSLGKKQSLLIEKLAPIIRKWCNYFKDKNINKIGISYPLGIYFMKNHSIFKKICFSKYSKIDQTTQIKKINLATDFSLIKNLWKWSLKRHKNKNNSWIQSKYFNSINNNQFLFTQKRQTCLLESLSLQKKDIKKFITYQKNNCKMLITQKEKVFIKNIFVPITNHY